MKLKKLFILLKPYIIWIILALILSLIEAATTYFTPITYLDDAGYDIKNE